MITASSMNCDSGHDMKHPLRPAKASKMMRVYVVIALARWEAVLCLTSRCGITRGANILCLGEEE